MVGDTKLLPRPPRDRAKFCLRVSVYRGLVTMFLPCDMTEAEAKKLARVILAYGRNVTTWNVRPLS